MSIAFQVIAPPTYEPLTTEQAKTYMRLDYPEEDSLISQLISDARSYAETVMHRALVPQTIQTINTLERPEGGELSGPIQRGPSWYQYEEQLGANPFGSAMFYFDLPMPPTTSITLIEGRVTVWDPWVTWTGITTLDPTPEPARLYFQVPATYNQWRFTYPSGYDGVTRFLPPDMRQVLLEMVAFWFDHREGDDLPDGIMNKLYAKKVDWVG